MKTILKICLIHKVTRSTLALILLFITPCYGLDATLKWDANTEPGFDHYEVFSRIEGQTYDYDNPAWQGTSTDYTFIGLDDNTTYYFVVRAVGLVEGVEVESRNSREVCLLVSNDVDPDYDRGWAITEGDLKGFAVLYNDPVNADDDTPTLGPSSDIPALHDAFPNIIGIGAPLNLQPSPTTAFYYPVKISIPCPGYSNVSGLDIYYYNVTNWVLANDAADPGTVLPDAAGWMVPGSRVNHSGGTPSTIEIRVNHFSGVQAGVYSSSPASTSGGGGGGGGCFIATAAFEVN